MTWVVIWAALVLGACAVLFLLGRRLWRQIKALTAELGVASDRLGEITDRLADLEAAREAVEQDWDGVRSRGQRRRP
ncbi:MAG TPA: hypothetical protein VF227_05890 [Actinomycetes bacterium]|jgi:hypothetical protein